MAITQAQVLLILTQSYNVATNFYVLVAVSLGQASAQLNDIFMPWFTCGCLTQRKDQSTISVCIQGTVPLTISQLCSNSTSIGAGPDPSTFPIVRSMLELWSTLSAKGKPRAAHTSTLSTLGYHNTPGGC